MAFVQADMEALLAQPLVPVEDRIELHTTNAIKRALRAVLRCPHCMTCSNNPGSIDRIILDVLAHPNSSREQRFPRLWTGGLT